MCGGRQNALAGLCLQESDCRRAWTVAAEVHPVLARPHSGPRQPLTTVGSQRLAGPSWRQGPPFNPVELPLGCGRRGAPPNFPPSLGSDSSLSLSLLLLPFHRQNSVMLNLVLASVSQRTQTSSLITVFNTVAFFYNQISFVDAVRNTSCARVHTLHQMLEAQGMRTVQNLCPLI